MSKPFNDVQENIQKKAEEELKRLQKQQEEEYSLAKRSYCPKCKARMHEIGGMKVSGGTNSKHQALSGNYCMDCYIAFIAANVPRYEVEPEEPKIIV